MTETWKTIPGLPLGYEVSNLGSVRINYGDHADRLTPTISGGYPCVCLLGKSLKLHKIVAEAFVPNPNNYPRVYHIDGNRFNNCVDNLKWASVSEISKIFYHGPLTSNTN